MRSRERPDVFCLPQGSDVTVERDGAAVTLWLDAERRRAHVHRFDYAPFLSEAEGKHAFMRLWREVAAERWLDARR